ncbi:MAG: helix-turn-helix domain-containing protein [bacterium]|nr:helix-turn-helix domain-containing protein [bacterium]
MVKSRTYSTFAREAARLLGMEIKLARKQCKWSEGELATRAGISRYTLQKIEKGDMTCAIGLVFEAASLVGINLFEAETSPLRRQIGAADDKISLLPKSTHNPKKAIDDDF